MRSYEILNEEPKQGYYDTYLPDDFEPYFELDEILYICEWILSSTPESTAKIKSILDGMPLKSKKTSSPMCFRYIGLSKDQTVELLNGKDFPCNTYESWTGSLGALESFYTVNNRYDEISYEVDFHVILKMQPSSSNVVLCLKSLVVTGEWEDSVEYWKNQLHGNDDIKEAMSNIKQMNDVDEVIMANRKFDRTNLVNVFMPGHADSNQFVQKPLTSVVNYVKDAIDQYLS